MRRWLREDREREEPHCQHNERADQGNLEDGKPPWRCATLRWRTHPVGTCPGWLWIHRRQRPGLLKRDDELRTPSRCFILQEGVLREVADRTSEGCRSPEPCG